MTSGRLRFLRSFSGALGAASSSVVVLAIAVLGRYVAPHDPSAPIGAPAQRRLEQRLARHRLPRPRRLQPPALRRPLGDRWSRSPRRCSRTLIGLAIGLIAGYSRSLRRPDPDALGRRHARVPAAAVPAHPDHGRRHRRRRPDPRRRDHPGAGASAASSARRRRSRPCAPTWRPPSRAASARSRSSAGRSLPNILAPVLVDSGLRFTFSILIIASVNFLGLGLQPPSPDWALMISENREFISVNVLAVLAPAAMIAAAHDRHQPGGRRASHARSAARTCRKTARSVTE